MSYSALEMSVSSGQPIELYRFQSSVSGLWLYTSSDESQLYGADVYTVWPIKRGKIGQTPEMAKSKLEIRTTRDNPMVAQLIADPLQGVITLTIYREHRGDGNFISFWQGRIMGIALQGAEAILTCEPVFTSMRRMGLRAVAQRQCRFALYDIGCKVSDAAFASLPGTISSVSGATIQSAIFATQANGWWVGGKIKVGVNTYRMITSHSSTQVTLTSAVPGLVAGNTVVAYPGCDHTPGTCNSKFGNILNYGGLPWMPVKNPFTGDATF